MPRLLSNRLARDIQREVATGAYGDVAIYYAPGSSVTGLDSLGHPIDPTTGRRIACNFNDSVRNRQSMEKWTSTADIAEITAEVRFAPNTIVPVKGGRFTLVYKHDNPNTRIDLTYDVVDIRDRGELGFVCALKTATL